MQRIYEQQMKERKSVKMAKKNSIVLASASPRRLELLASAGWRSMSSQRHTRGGDAGRDPEDHVRRLARTRRSSRRGGRRPVVHRADTVVVCDGEIMGNRLTRSMRSGC